MNSMKYKYKLQLGALLGAMILMSLGCKKMTEEHNAIGDPMLQKNVFEVISQNPSLSTFAKYLVETGLDKELASSKSYTVFAPNNESLILLDATVRANPAKLKQFIANHITEELVRFSNATPKKRILMLNGKYNAIAPFSIESAVSTQANQYASNGILHTINMSVNALDNCWEFMAGNAAAPVKQRAFLQSLFRNVFDPTNATIVGINPTTGEPIYQKGTDSVYTNLFWRNVHDLRDETKQFTAFILADGGWDAERAAYARFFPTGSADSTTFATAWNIARDFAVDTLYTPSGLPDTVVSKFGAKLPINKSSIVASIKTSNGYVYVMSSMPVAPALRFATRVIEAERYSGVSHDRRSQTFFRDRFNDLTRRPYSDVLVLNHGIALFNLRYDIPEVPAIRYRAFWVAVNDFQTATFTQRLGVGSPLSTLLPYVNVVANTRGEVFLGEFTLTTYSPVLSLFLTAANSTANAANPLVCDYIKLVPSL